jgi:hypothetical protein
LGKGDSTCILYFIDEVSEVQRSQLIDLFKVTELMVHALDSKPLPSSSKSFLNQMDKMGGSGHQFQYQRTETNYSKETFCFFSFFCLSKTFSYPMLHTRLIDFQGLNSLGSLKAITKQQRKKQSQLVKERKDHVLPFIF